MKMTLPLIAFASLLLLSGCGGRAQPEGSFLNPVCMPDGSVVLRQLPNTNDQYGKPIARHSYCSWNKKAH